MTVTIRTITTPIATVAIDDGSDGQGLTVDQIVNVAGKPGKWRVLKVHSPIGRSRVYDIAQVVGNRGQRRAADRKMRREK